MNYIDTLTVPADTPNHTPAELILNPVAGMLKSISISFPNGCLNAVYIKVLDNGSQIFPYPSGWKSGNNETVKVNINRRLSGPPYRVSVLGYSLAIDWEHKLTIDLEVER